MTWYFDPSGDTMDVYDHTGAKVASGREFGGGWNGDYPSEVLDVMYENLEGDQPSAYNQSLIAAASCEQIEEGTPP